MYKLYTYLLYLYPIALLFSIFSDKQGLIYKSSIYMFFAGIILYLSFPVVLLIRGVFQVKKDSTLPKLLQRISEKFPKMHFNVPLISGGIKIFTVIFLIALAIYTAGFSFIKLITTKYPNEVTLVIDSMANASDYVHKLDKIERTLENLERKEYEAKRRDYFNVNEDLYKFKTPSAEFTLYNNEVLEDVPGFNNKYHYKLSFCFNYTFTQQLKENDPGFYFLGCPFVSDERNRSQFDNLFVFQDEKVEDFYVKPYTMGASKLPIYIGTVETTQRDITFFLYPRYSEKSGYDYVFKGLSSTVNIHGSHFCTLSDETTSTLKYSCVNRYPDKYSNNNIDPNEEIWVISVSPTGELNSTPVFK